MRRLTLEQVNPVVRGANYASMKPLKFGPRINYGYQLFYVFSGTGTGCINKNELELHPGLIAIYGPGDVHEFRSRGHEAMTFATIYFSWEKVDAKRMATANHSVTELSDEYWRLADPKVSVSGFPAIPFISGLPPQECIMLETLLRETANSFRSSNDLLQQLKYKSALLRIFYEIIKIKQDNSGYTEHRIIRSFRKYIDESYRNKLNRNNVSNVLGISESYLTALLRKELNTNFTDYLTSTRMQKAMELLQYSNLSTKEISTAVGFQDYNYFVARFRQIHSKPPGTFR
jgi:AraC-like DNA-binding protein/mannose-6-phosphate isomerase-like protein (cupin superfamily)